jgi:GTP-binding protein Era
VTRCGTVAIVGAPNAGKSTLLNRVAGEHLAIVSPRPQSTRVRITAIVTRDNTQFLFVDTPGLLEPKYHLQRAMQAEVQEAVERADVTLFVVDASDPRGTADDADLPLSSRSPSLVAFNKWDSAPENVREALAARTPTAVPISAATGEGVEELLQRLAPLVPEGPLLYPADELSTQPMRLFVTEAIREAAFEALDEELPYSVHCEVEEYREAKVPVYIRVTLYVERDSQKGILIGRSGAMVREISRRARLSIESLIGAPVYLDLWVKVLPNWRRNVSTLERLGYSFGGPK